MSKPTRAIPDLPIELAMYSDRACAVVAGGLLDLLLENLLRKSMVTNVNNALFENYGPLSSFSAKVDIAFAFGLISSSEAEDLHKVRRIRNAFAHSIEELHFDKSPNREHISKINFLTSKMLNKDRTPREDFVNCVAMLSGFLKGRIDKVVTPPDVKDMLPLIDKYAESKSIGSS